MGNSKDARLVNLLGAAALGLSDAVGERVSAAAGLDAVAATALVAMLDFTPAGSVTRLSQVTGLTHSGAVRLVDRLVRAGYVDRWPGPDARSRAISLTASGRGVAQRARRARRASIEQVIAELGDSQRESLAEFAADLVDRLATLRLQARARGRPPEGGALCRLCDFRACGRADGHCPATGVANS